LILNLQQFRWNINYPRRVSWKKNLKKKIIVVQSNAIKNILNASIKENMSQSVI